MTPLPRKKKTLARAALLATISSAVVTAAELADARLLNHRESEVVSIIEVVQDHGVGLSEGLSLRGLKSSEDLLEAGIYPCG